MYCASLVSEQILQVISDSARSQNVLSGLVSQCAVDQDNLSGLVRTSTNEELSNESHKLASFPTWQLVMTKNWLVCGNLTCEVRSPKGSIKISLLYTSCPSPYKQSLFLWYKRDNRGSACRVAVPPSGWWYLQDPTYQSDMITEKWNYLIVE